MQLGSCPRPLHEQYDAALCDLDGVLHLGDEPVAHAAATVATAKAAGMRFAYVTNNASRSPDVVARRLAGMGMPAEPQDVVTSAQAAGRTLASRLPAGAAVLVVGTDALADEVRSVGLRPVRTVDEAGQDGPAAVVQGLASTTSYTDLAEAAVALNEGALWVAGNTDATLPTTRGLLPGNGALVAALELVTGRTPLVSGKPDPALHQESVDRVRAERPLVVGDRLDTDVLGAVRGGADSLLVLTGVVGIRELLQAPVGSRPTYVSSDLRGLLEPHPAVTVGRSSAQCGAARATYDGEVVDADLSTDDGIRAVVALAWAVADDGGSVTLAARAVNGAASGAASGTSSVSDGSVGPLAAR
jgi:HAD superfamily hydrolase (TIGR01450 family)